MKPTEKEIERQTHGFTSEYKIGFEEAIEWLLNWQKMQELQTRCHCGEIEVEPHTCPYKEDVDNNSAALCRCCSVCKSRCADDIL